MAHIISNILLIAISTVIIIDISGFIDTIKHQLKRWLNIKGDISLKPFDCSLCSTFWLSVIYLFTQHTITIPYITLSLFVAILTPQINFLLHQIQDILTNIIEKLNK